MADAGHLALRVNALTPGDPVRILVAYATRHGATAGIAERIASRLAENGIPAEAHPVADVDDVGLYPGAKKCFSVRGTRNLLPLASASA